MKRVKQLTGRAGAFNFTRELQGSTLGLYWQHNSINSMSSFHLSSFFLLSLFFFIFPFELSTSFIPLSDQIPAVMEQFIWLLSFIMVQQLNASMYTIALYKTNSHYATP